MATISISAKCSDMCFVTWPDGRTSDGYVPTIDGLGGGDYLNLEIDVETGRIVGWLGPEDVQEAQSQLMEEEEEDSDDE